MELGKGKEMKMEKYSKEFLGQNEGHFFVVQTKE